MSWRGARIVVLVGAPALALLASACDDGGGAETADEPSVNISRPDVGPVLVRAASFEIGGAFGGQVNTIDVSIDGVGVGRATPGELDEWRLPASRVAVSPGPHEIVATATGDAGTDSDQLWVFYQPDLAATFAVTVMPETASYGPGDRAADPRLQFFGPGFGDDFSLAVTVDDHAEIVASTNDSIATGSSTDLVVELVDPSPDTYPIVVRAVNDDGEERTATHTVTITGPPPTDPPAPSDPAPTTTATGTDGVVVLTDDFEGADRWTATVTGATNGAEATAELAGGGNPGGQRRMTHMLPGTDDAENNATRISVLHLYTGGGWDPATDGALARIDYAEDRIEFEPPFEGAAIGARFVIVQDGTTFTAPVYENNAFTNLAWETTRVTDLTAADFSPAPGPDFSAAGGPMTFGYLRSNTNNSATGITTQHGIDNWTVELLAE